MKPSALKARFRWFLILAQIDNRDNNDASRVMLAKNTVRESVHYLATDSLEIEGRDRGKNRDTGEVCVDRGHEFNAEAVAPLGCATAGTLAHHPRKRRRAPLPSPEGRMEGIEPSMPGYHKAAFVYFPESSLWNPS